ncbi:flavodoxin-dependent (E)-4-hydroxy-3-methylbut-2-enyl-diphosphate synthase [Liberiplasma polymorphum]|uniref:flavodoxin-dependent (E)-4-hydroxy-3-methylbut-2-enyl-diphosphate synthase n=1 Tax=Liberiplasma polymorphum TaxID=3374570 RepID=UPI003772E338
MKRTQTKKVFVKHLQIGGQNKVVIQTMTQNKTSNIEKVVNEINTYATNGADLIRLAILDMEDAEALKEIRKQTNALLVADIHFDYRLALKAIENGIDKIRINPGNIGSIDKVEAVVKACKEKKIPIRIGVNAGSLEKDLLETYGRTAQAMIESAKRHIALLENLDFYDTIISLKASDVTLTIDAYLLASKTFDYPLHIGITEAGPLYQGIIASSAGLGSLLYHGIGDTIRISLTADRLDELKACKTLLASFNLYTAPKIISCPTCGRLSYDMKPFLAKVEDYLNTNQINLTVAVMGCAVNGPGEAKEADIGIAGGKNEGLIFVKGKIKRKVSQEALFDAFIEEITLFQKENAD